MQPVFGELEELTEGITIGADGYEGSPVVAASSAV
jgi:hypothetical protein